jgi:16S rRNA (cytosine1402-N4)-methyltransferase
MTGRSNGIPEAPGGLTRHVPVLLADALDALAVKPGGRYLDGTFGAGGYTKALLERDPGIEVLALDRDPSAIIGGFDLVEQAGGRLKLVEAEFGDLAEIATAHRFAPLDGIVLDIGVSSMQIDEAERGFSFRQDGPLDMRMASGEGATGRSAADIVNFASEAELADIFHYYGEERRARAVARTIIEARRRQPLTRTGELASLIVTVVRTEPGGINPATRCFQGLRIAVNDELGQLLRALVAAESVLAPGGRLSVVTFHSLEDRIVKQFMASRAGRKPAASRHLPLAMVETPSFRLVGRCPVLPSLSETRANPRARSAKLRIAERTDGPAMALENDLMALASLPTQKPRQNAHTPKRRG